MDVLEEVEQVENNTSSEKQEVLNKIIAAGLNSLIPWTPEHHKDSPERKLLNAFAEQSFEKIIPCFELLDQRIQLYVFKPHKEAFLEYMLQKQEG